MKKLADISQFEAIVENRKSEMGSSSLGIFNPEAHVVENAPGLDFTSNPNGSVSGGGVMPPSNIPQQGDGKHIPEWGRGLSGRVDNLDKRVGNLEKVVKEGFAETKKLFIEVNQRFVGIDQRFGTIEQDVTAIKQEVVAIKQDVVAIKQAVLK